MDKSNNVETSTTGTTSVVPVVKSTTEIPATVPVVKSTTETPATVPAVKSTKPPTELILFPPSYANFTSVFTFSTFVIFFSIFTVIFLINKLTGFMTLQPYIPFIIAEFVNLSVFLCIMVLCCKFYYTTEEDKSELVPLFLNKLKDFLADSNSVLTILFVLILLYVFMYFIGSPLLGDGKPLSLKIIESFLFILLIIIFIIYFFNNVLNMPVIDWMFNNVKNNFKEIHDEIKDVSLSTVDISKPEVAPEVFNITNNLYTYDDAKSVCSAFDASLATYEQIEKSYVNGGEWCSMGWSADQQALFPTQKSTWKELQKIKGHEHDCGRAGVNGGYISNPQLRFGVNCFGKKPTPKKSDLEYLEQNKHVVYPKTIKDKIMDAKVEYWKKHADNFLSINSFNKDKWSYY